MFREFVNDISLSPEEMRLYVAMPELSIADVKSLIADREEPCRRATGSSEPNRYVPRQCRKKKPARRRSGQAAGAWIARRFADSR